MLNFKYMKKMLLSYSRSMQLFEEREKATKSANVQYKKSYIVEYKQ